MNCPHCNESVDVKTRVCSYCNKDISPTAPIDIDIKTRDNHGTVIGYKNETHITKYDQKTVRDHRDKASLRQLVKLEWIEGALKQVETRHATFVYDAGLIKLRKRIQPEAVDYYSAAADEVSYLESSPDYLPQDKKIGEIFDQMGKALLILGTPGSGKTVTLLELARDLVSRAEKDANAPIPIVLNLSSWANNKSSIVDWIIDKLNSNQYGFVNRKIGRNWLENRDLVLLLDGLDEVSYNDREACVAAINQFLSEYGMGGIVVCCRSEEYKQLKTRLKLRGALLLQSLTQEQIKDYFDTAGSSLANLHTALQRDAPLRQLAETPLMLHIMSLTYQDMPITDLKIGQFDSVEDRRPDLFDSYIERMLKRKGKRGPSYPKEQAKKLLSVLAKNRSPRPQEVFFIEHMQPKEWLSKRPQRMHVVGVRLAGCLTWVLVTIPAVGILVGPYFFSSQHPLLQGVRETFEGLSISLSWQQFSVLAVVSSGLVIGMILGIVWNVFDWIGVQIGQQMEKLQERDKRRPNRRLSDRTWKILSVFAAMVVCGLLGGVLGWFMGWIAGPAWVLFFALIGGVSGVFAVVRERRIVVMERFIPSKSNMIGGGLWGLLLGLVLGIVGSLILNEPILVGLVFGMGLGAALGMIGGLIFGVTAREEDREVELKKRIKPNQGIWQTGGIGLLAALATTFGTCLLLRFGVGLSLLLYGAAFSDVVQTLKVALIPFAWLAVMLGVMVGLSFGGLAWIEHWILRLILYLEELIPWNYVPFLDYAAQRIFLQKVGGGYRFIHPYLLEHFAKMGETEKESS